MSQPESTAAREPLGRRAPGLVWRTLALLVVAAGAAVFALCFRYAFDAVFEHVYRAQDLLEAFADLPVALCILVPCVGGAIAGGLSLFAARYGGAQGVGGVMEVLVLEGRRISIRGTALRALGSWFAIVTGGSVGREGPLIQFGGGLGAGIGSLARLPLAERRTLVAAGTAAGFAAAYNAPLAAMLFVFEIVIGALRVEVVAKVAIATAVATAISRAAVGGGPIYGLRTFSLASDYELAAHALLGALTGLAAVGFMALIGASERAFARLSLPRWGTTALGGVGVGVLAVFLPAVTGNGFEAIRLLLDARPTLGIVLLLLVAKALATASSVGSGTPGGVFTPSLFLGAAVGAALGQLLGLIFGSDQVGATGGYALVGMAASVAATTHAPMMAAVLAYELSGDYAIVLPLLIATATSTLVARALRRDSVYTAELRRAGLAFRATSRGREVQWVGRPKADVGGGI